VTLHELGRLDVTVGRGREVHSPDDGAVLIGPVNVRKHGVRAAPAERPCVEAFVALELRAEHPNQAGFELLAISEGHGELRTIGQPVEVAPHFATDDFPRPFSVVEPSACGDDRQGDGDVRVVGVGEVVGVEDFGGRGAKHRDEVLNECGFGDVLYRSARMVEKHERSVLAELGCPLLFGTPPRGELVGARRRYDTVRDRTRWGRGPTGTVCRDDAREPRRVALVAGEDPVDRHDLEIVGMGADAEVRRA
jgi:hypothetical protein